MMFTFSLIFLIIITWRVLTNSNEDITKRLVLLFKTLLLLDKQYIMPMCICSNATPFINIIHLSILGSLLYLSFTERQFRNYR